MLKLQVVLANPKGNQRNVMSYPQACYVSPNGEGVKLPFPPSPEHSQPLAFERDQRFQFLAPKALTHFVYGSTKIRKGLPNKKHTKTTAKKEPSFQTTCQTYTKQKTYSAFQLPSLAKRQRPTTAGAFTGAKTRKAKGTKGPTAASSSKAFSKASRKMAA